MKLVQSCVSNIIQLLPVHVSITHLKRRRWAWPIDDWMTAIGRRRGDLLKRHAASTAYLAAPTSRMRCNNISAS